MRENKVNIINIFITIHCVKASRAKLIHTGDYLSPVQRLSVTKSNTFSNERSKNFFSHTLKRLRTQS